MFYEINFLRVIGINRCLSIVNVFVDRYIIFLVIEYMWCFVSIIYLIYIKKG